MSLSYPVGHVVRQVLALGCLNLPLGHVEHVDEVPAVHVAHVESQAEHICPEVFPKNPLGQEVPQALVAVLKNLPDPQVRQAVAPEALQVAHVLSQAEQVLAPVFL